LKPSATARIKGIVFMIFGIVFFVATLLALCFDLFGDIGPTIAMMIFTLFFTCLSIVLFVQSKKLRAKEHAPTPPKTTLIKCENCGATSEVQVNKVASCPYCDSKIHASVDSLFGTIFGTPDSDPNISSTQKIIINGKEVDPSSDDATRILNDVSQTIAKAFEQK